MWSMAEEHYCYTVINSQFFHLYLEIKSVLLNSNGVHTVRMTDVADKST